MTARVEELEEANKALHEELLQTKAALAATRSTLELTTTQLLQATQQTNAFTAASAQSVGSAIQNNLVAAVTTQSPVVPVVAPQQPPCAAVNADPSAALLAALASTMAGGLVAGGNVSTVQTVTSVADPLLTAPKTEDFQQQLQAALTAAMLLNC